MRKPTVEEHLRLARSVLGETEVPHEGAFLSGSVVEGFANSTSDLDLYLLVSPDQFAHHASTATATYEHTTITLDFRDDAKIDAEAWDIREVQRLVALTNSLDRSEKDISAVLTDPEVQLLHRIRIGVAVHPNEHLHRLQAEGDWQALAALIARRAERSYNGHAEDAIGAISARDAETAMLTSRMALEASVDYMTASCGETNTKPKWRAARLRKLGLHSQLADFRRAELDPAGDDDSLLAQAKNRLRAASAMLVATQSL